MVNSLFVWLFIYWEVFFFLNWPFNLELDKLLRPEIKPSDLKNELAENIVCIAKEYVDDDEKYFPLGIFFRIYYLKLILNKSLNTIFNA